MKTYTSTTEASDLATVAVCSALILQLYTEFCASHVICKIVAYNIKHSAISTAHSKCIWKCKETGRNFLPPLASPTAPTATCMHLT